MPGNSQRQRGRGLPSLALRAPGHEDARRFRISHCPQHRLYAAGGPRRVPMTSDAMNRMMNTTNRTQAISDASHSTRNNPNAPATRAMSRKMIASRSMGATSEDVSLGQERQ